MGYQPTRTFHRRNALKAAAGAAAFAAAAPYVSYPTRASAQGSTQLRLSTFANPDEQATINTQLRAFEAANPGITVTLESVPTDYPTKITTDLAAGTAPDVFWVDSMLAPDLTTRGLLLPLDDLLASTPNGNDYFPNLLAAYQYNGQTLGLPKDWSALAMWYSTDDFATAGLTAAPTNWDELRATLQALTDSLGTPGGIIVPDPARMLAFLYQAGGEILSSDFSQVLIGDQATVDALEFYYGLYRDGLATTPADAGSNDQGAAFGDRLGSLTFEGNWNFGNYDLNYPDLKYGVAPLPAGPTGIQATFAFTVAYSIFAGTPAPDAAFSLVQFLNNDETMLNLTTSAGVMPSRSTLTPQWLATFPERQLFVDAAAYARPWQLGPGGLLFNGDATSILQNLFAGQIEVAEAAQQMADRANADIQLQSPATATPAS